MDILNVRCEMRKDSYLKMSLNWTEEEMRTLNVAGVSQIQICLFNFKEESILFQMKKEILCPECQMGL